MKKLSFIGLAAALFCSAAMFTSCENENTGGSGTDPVTPGNEGNSLKLLDAAYYGETDGVGEIDLIFTSGDLVINNGKPSGTGDYVYLSLLAEVGDDLFPKAGKYTFLDLNDESTYTNGKIIPGFGSDKGNMGTYVIPCKNSTKGQGFFVNDGEVTFSGNAANATAKMTLRYKDKEGNVIDSLKREYTFAGKNLTVQDLRKNENDAKYEIEDKNPTNFETTYTSAVITNYGDYHGVGCDYMILDLQGSDYRANFALFGKGVDIEVADGKYTINNQAAPFGAEISGGAIQDKDGYSILPPFVGVPVPDGLSNVWFITSGTVTIAADGVTFDVKSYFGSTIKGTYKGKVEMKPAQQQVAPSLNKIAGK